VQATPFPGGVISSSRPACRAATQLLRVLAERGVRVAFGIPGGAIGPIFDALHDVPEIELVATRHETTAVFAATGYARATGTPALVLVTSGPGVTNTLTGVASAHLEEVPVIIIGGDIPATWRGRAAFQDGSSGGLDLVSLMRGVTRFSASVESPANVAGVVSRAWMAATEGRPGPVFLSVPYDIAQATTDRSVVTFAEATPCSEPNAVSTRAAAELMSSAKRPLLVLGSGARAATREAVELAENANVPVAVTSHAKGVFPERHPLYLGLAGNAGHPSVNEYVASEPDVVCVVGSRLGDFATSGWRLSLAGRRATIHVDRDPVMLGRNTSMTLGIVGDARRVLAAMSDALPAKPSVRACVSRRTRAWSTNAPAGMVKPQNAVLSIQSAFPDATFCSDIGEHMTFAQHYLTVDSPERFHCFTGLGSMGSGFGAAIGIKHARRDARVVVFVGDGGFHMHAGDLLTCVEQRLGIVFAVFNDGCWNMVDHGFRAVFRRKPSSFASRVTNIAEIARGYGADALVIDHPSLLEPSRLASHARDGVPLVLDVRIDPSEALSPLSRAADLATLLRSV
jgi:acetolactate synthase-1/2/3 large subunit